MKRARVALGLGSHLAIWSNRDGSGWTVVYSDRRP